MFPSPTDAEPKFLHKLEICAEPVKKIARTILCEVC